MGKRGKIPSNGRNDQTKATINCISCPIARRIHFYFTSKIELLFQISICMFQHNEEIIFGRRAEFGIPIESDSLCHR